MSDVANSDEVLMQRVAGGDQQALEELVRRYADRLLTFIHRTVGNRHRAEEIFQETIFTIWRKSRQYNSNQPFRPWLYKIALNGCRVDFRKARLPTQAMLEDAVPGESLDDPQAIAAAAESHAAVKEAVARLPAQQRAVVTMRIWSGLSYAEIADVVDVAESTVRSYMFHALTSLRHILSPIVVDD